MGGRKIAEKLVEVGLISGEERREGKEEAYTL